MRLVFWLGALLVGSAAVLFSMMAQRADLTFAELADRC